MTADDRAGTGPTTGAVPAPGASPALAPAGPPALSHVDGAGAARMVDVGAKPATARSARAGGTIRMSAEAYALVAANRLAKGDVLAVARVAGVMAAKRTAELIPLCHPLALTHADVACALDPALPGVRVEATARTVGPTGVEMEALTAATVALLAIYDMAKAADAAMEIGAIRLLEKTGGTRHTTGPTTVREVHSSPPPADTLASGAAVPPGTAGDDAQAPTAVLAVPTRPDSGPAGGAPRADTPPNPTSDA